MRKGNFVTALSAAILLLPAAAWAGHGKAGLWNVSTTMNMSNIQIPPEAMAQMKKAGVKMPTAQTFTSQMCMTQAEVDSDKPPSMRNDSGCATKVISQTATGMTAEMTCTGRMNGTGQMQVSYSSPEHYPGSYSFKGDMQGHPMNTSTSFSGDWVKADCGAVKPFSMK